MFRKYQEFTMKLFFDSGLNSASSDLSVAAGLYILLFLAEVIGSLACFIWICSDGFNHITIPWASLHIVFWSTALLSIGFKNKYNFSQRTNYDSLSPEEKRYIFKVSILLFINLMSCGIMVVALPIMIIVGICNIIIDGISNCLFPDPVKEKSSKELSSQFDTILK